MKKLGIYFLIIITLSFQGCKDKLQVDNKGQKENNNTIVEEKSNKFEALNRSYDENQDIAKCLKNDEVFNSGDESNNDFDKYMEVKYANDLISDYLKGESDIYDNLFSIVEDTIQYKISDEDKSRLSHDIESLKSQMSINNESPIYFKLKTVNYLGQIGGITQSVILNVKGLISKDNKNFQSLSSFDVTILKKDGKIYGHIR